MPDGAGDAAADIVFLRREWRAQSIPGASSMAAKGTKFDQPNPFSDPVDREIYEAHRRFVEVMEAERLATISAGTKEQYLRIMKSLAMVPGPADLRSWLLHVCDDLGDELFVMPFTFVLGKPH